MRLETPFMAPRPSLLRTSITTFFVSTVLILAICLSPPYNPSNSNKNRYLHRQDAALGLVATASGQPNRRLVESYTPSPTATPSPIPFGEIGSFHELTAEVCARCGEAAVDLVAQGGIVVPLRASSSCTLGNWSLSINALLEPTDPKLPPALRQCPLSAYPTLLSQLQPGWLCTFLLIDVEWSPDDSVSFHPNAPALVTMDINFITQEQVKQYRPVLVLGTLPTASTHGCSSSVSFNTTTRVSTATVCQGGRWLLVYNPYPPYIRPLSWILTLVGVPLGGLVALALIIILSRVVWVWFHSRIKPVPLSNPLPIVHKPRKIHRAFARQEKVLLTKLDDIVIDKDSKYAADAQGGRQEPPDPAIARASSLERSMTEQLPVPASPPSPPAPSPFLRLAALLRLRREGHAPPYRPRVHIHVSAGGVATTEPPSNAGTAAAFAADIAAEGINSMKRRKAAAKRHNKHRLQILQDPEFEHGYPQLLGIQRVSEAKKEMARLKKAAEPPVTRFRK